MSEITDLIMRVRNSAMPEGMRYMLERALLSDGPTDYLKQCIEEQRSPSILQRMATKAVVAEDRRMEAQVVDDDQIRCAKCGSTQITVNDKGFGVGKAAAGALLLGPVGLLGGMIGSKKPMLTCLKCGHRWKAGDR